MCLLLMVQGKLLSVTGTHLAIAAKTGLVAGLPAVAMTFTPLARHRMNPWTDSLAHSFLHHRQTSAK